MFFSKSSSKSTSASRGEETHPSSGASHSSSSTPGSSSWRPGPSSAAAPSAPHSEVKYPSRAAQIKEAQEAALARLPHNALFIVLYIRSEEPRRNDFHWGLYHHKSFADGGVKYHVKNMSTGWITDHGSTRGVFKSTFLCVLIQIATISPASAGQMDQVIRARD